MAIFRITPEMSEVLAGKPEIFPNVQYMKRRDGEGIATIVGGMVGVINFDPGVDFIDFAAHDQKRPIRFDEQFRMADFEHWFQALPEEDNWDVITPRASEAWQLALRLSPLPPHPTVFFPPPPYGHLPLSGKTSPNETYYRCEAFPVSRRIVGDTVKANTFAIPHSELPFIPTGLSVVGRYALPCFFPAIFRYTLQPPRNTHLKCGACVPQFGQAGGGVEVMFVKDTTMRATIAPPHQTPAL